MSISQEADVIIIGAGLAGATAAAKLCGEGLRVTILEARNRCGGRGYARAFGNSGEVVDYGGSWITPWQVNIRELCARYGVALRPREKITERRWYRDGALHRDGPTSAADRPAHESAIARMAAHSALLKAGLSTDHHGFTFAGISLAAYLDGLNLPQATRDLVSAWWTVSGNGDKERVPATEFLHSIGYFDGTPDGMCEVWADSLVGGVTLLAERMIAASGAQLRLSCPVSALSEDRSGVRVAATDGRTFSARRAILATGINPLAGIRVTPPLSAEKSAAVSVGHLGRAVKIWAKVENVPVGILATGGGRGIEWMFSERSLADGSTLLVGFGVAANGWAPEMPRDAAEAVARFFPEANLLAIDWHDWNTDDYSQGAWVAGIVGQPEAHEARTWRANGNLAFASSDIAAREAGWFEAAIISGEDAAQEISRSLAPASNS